MRKASRKLINAIKKAAKKLRSNSAYSWGHLGSCNCGHLVQSLTKLNKDEIHEAAIESNGDWSEISRKYCDNSGLKIDKIISIMLDEGLNIEDIEYLENLSDPRIIRRMKVDIKSLRRNDRLFVINYLEVWAEILEEKSVIKSQKNALNDQLQSTDIYGKQEFETDKELNGLANKSNTSTT